MEEILFFDYFWCLMFFTLAKRMEKALYVQHSVLYALWKTILFVSVSFWFSCVKFT